MKIEAIFDLTGLTLESRGVQTVLDYWGLTPGGDYPKTIILRASAMLARVQATPTSQTAVTRVEDISVDYRRVADSWLQLAQQFETEADALDHGGAPRIVEFMPARGEAWS